MSGLNISNTNNDCITFINHGFIRFEIHLITERYGMAKVDMLWQELGYVLLPFGMI